MKSDDGRLKLYNKKSTGGGEGAGADRCRYKLLAEEKRLRIWFVVAVVVVVVVVVFVVVVVVAAVVFAVIVVVVEKRGYMRIYIY